MLKTIFGFIVIQLGATSFVKIGEDRLSGEKKTRKNVLYYHGTKYQRLFSLVGPFFEKGGGCIENFGHKVKL